MAARYRVRWVSLFLIMPMMMIFISSCDSVLSKQEVARIRFVNMTDANIQKIVLVTYDLNKAGNISPLKYFNIEIGETTDYLEIEGEGKRYTSNLFLTIDKERGYIVHFQSRRLQSTNYTFQLSSVPSKKLVGSIYGTQSTDSSGTKVRIHNDAEVSFDQVSLSFTRISDSTSTNTSSVSFRSVPSGNTTAFKPIDFAAPYATAEVVTEGDTLFWFATDAIGDRTLPDGKYTYSLHIMDDLEFFAELVD